MRFEMGRDGTITPENPGACDLCTKPAHLHLTEIKDGVKTTRSLCYDHAPPEMRDTMPFGRHRTPAEEAAFVRRQMTPLLDQLTDPAQRAEYQANLERLIADIESGRRRLGDPEPPAAEE
jgi:hypothetical protein